MIKHFINTATSIVILASSFQQSIARNCKLNETFSKHVTIKSGFYGKLPTDTTPKLPKKVTVSNAVKVGSTTGKITGKIINSKTGEPVYDATITIKNGNITRVTKSDYNGVYAVNELPEGTYTINVSHITYGNKKLEDVKIVSKDVTTQDIVLQESKGKNLEEVVVTTKGAGRIRESVASLLIQQKNAASVSDGISAEAIKRTPDRNTSDIMKRVSGASVQDDRFVVIRGLSDRYNAAFINGAPLPSSESDRKAFSFDIFPANMLDNLTISKTATPDMPADFAGGIINIVTKEIPTKDFQSVSFGLGYNTRATFKSRQYDKAGKLDFIGIDDGTRKLPSSLPSNSLRNFSSSEKAEFGKTLTNNWKVYDGGTSPNISFQYVKGKNFQKNGKDFFGMLLALTYNRNYNYTDGERLKIDYNRINSGQPPIIGSSSEIKEYTKQTLAGSIANFSIKLNSNNKVSFKNILSINSDDRIIDRTGFSDYADQSIKGFNKARWFSSNLIYSGQLIGEHFISIPKIKINWVGSYSSVSRQIPNVRYTGASINYNFSPPIFNNDVSTSTPSNSNAGTIFKSSTKENIKNFRIDIQRDFKFNNYNSIQVKTGIYLTKRDREFKARYLGMQFFDSSAVSYDRKLLQLSDEELFTANNFGRLKNGKYGLMLTEDYRDDNEYEASSNLFAYYLMLDARFLKFFRINGGLRSERFNQQLLSRNAKSKIDSTITDVLPSANLIISLNSKQNIRLSYSKTLNRPEYRELAPFLFYDYVTRLSISGSPQIQRATIDNYDVRYEIYPTGGQVFSISGFYKKIINPIELNIVPNLNEQAEYRNSIDAYIKGVEMEARVNLNTLFTKSSSLLLKQLTVFGNLAFMDSKVSNDTLLYGPDRPLQGQSPYLYNAGILFQNDKGFSSTLQINKAGQRIFISGTASDNNIWENGRAVLDFQIAKNFINKNIEVKFNIKDILAQRQIIFYDINNNNKYDKDNNLDYNNLKADSDKIFQSRRIGTVFSASITYKL